MSQLERDYAITAPVALAIAESISASKAARAKGSPEAVDLAEMITGVGEALTLQGAPQIQINLLDPDLALLESGFWGDDAAHGRLDEIELNYPTGSKYWWRLRQVSPKADFTVQTYWIPRVVRELMDKKGPKKASRGSRTRAEFLKMLAESVPEARFYSRQLDIKQPIANVKIPHSKSPSSAARSVGLSAKATKGLTVKGTAMTAEQRDVAGQLLQVADRANAGQVATEALIYAAIWESGLDPAADNGQFWGVLSGSHGEWQQTDTVGMAEAFLHSGKGFHDGAISLSHSTSNPVEIAVRVEVPSVWPNNAYAQQSGYPGDPQALAEVKAIIQAGGGATEGQTETVQQHNYEVGSAEEPYEDYWTAMNRLATEVNWELVVDGPDIYYDSEITLCKAELVDVIDRSDDNVVDWEYDWDDHEIATNFVLVVVCDEFAYKPADVVKLESFGPASECSTMGLPGCWLVGEAQRNPGDIMATLTLVQPTRPLKEPPQVKQGVSGTGEVAVKGTGEAFPMPKGAASQESSWTEDQGVDIAAAGGTPLLAVKSGVLVKNGISGFGPNAPVLDIGNGEYVYYGHAGPSQPPGTKVNAGDQVGIVGYGIVGLSTGPHLEIGFCDQNGAPVPGTSSKMMALLKRTYKP